MVPGLLEVCMV